MIVKVNTQGREWTLELREHHSPGEVEPKPDSWEVETESGKQIGRVFKSTYTSSPPTHRGSRIAKYHKQVKCWKMEEGPRAGVYGQHSGIGPDRYLHGPYQTRREALEGMVREFIERGEEEQKVLQFARDHPEARFQLYENGGASHGGEVIWLLNGGLMVRDKTKPGRTQDVKVRRRQIREDRGPTLRVQLRKGGRWQAIVNAMYEEEED